MIMAQAVTCVSFGNERGNSSWQLRSRIGRRTQARHLRSSASCAPSIEWMCKLGSSAVCHCLICNLGRFGPEAVVWLFCYVLVCKSGKIQEQRKRGCLVDHQRVGRRGHNPSQVRCCYTSASRGSGERTEKGSTHVDMIVPRCRSCRGPHPSIFPRPYPTRRPHPTAAALSPSLATQAR